MSDRYLSGERLFASSPESAFSLWDRQNHRPARYRRPVQPAQESFYPGTQPQKGSDGQSFDLFGAVRKIFKDIF